MKRYSFRLRRYQKIRTRIDPTLPPMAVAVPGSNPAVSPNTKPAEQNAGDKQDKAEEKPADEDTL